MWANLRAFFKEIGIILMMVADGSMEDYSDDSDLSDSDTGPM
jgi:hypothetical protein